MAQWLLIKQIQVSCVNDLGLVHLSVLREANLNPEYYVFMRELCVR